MRWHLIAPAEQITLSGTGDRPKMAAPILISANRQQRSTRRLLFMAMAKTINGPAYVTFARHALVNKSVASYVWDAVLPVDGRIKVKEWRETSEFWSIVLILLIEQRPEYTSRDGWRHTGTFRLCSQQWNYDSVRRHPAAPRRQLHLVSAAGGRSSASYNLRCSGGWPINKWPYR